MKDYINTAKQYAENTVATSCSPLPSVMGTDIFISTIQVVPVTLDTHIDF